jgi:hypothetical protein
LLNDNKKGFTPLCERLCKEGSFGVELLRNVISDFFAKFVPIIDETGGDIVKFAGGSYFVLIFF